MVAGERQHEAGREGVRQVKRWLESTTRFHVPWDVYGSPNQTTVTLLGGAAKAFDIAGHLIGEDAYAGPPFYGEVKNYRSVSNQPSLYQEYLAVSYSPPVRRRAQSTTLPSSSSGSRGTRSLRRSSSTYANQTRLPRPAPPTPATSAVRNSTGGSPRLLPAGYGSSS
jgi:hypothetical protein